jgi:hypothetical protein
MGEKRVHHNRGHAYGCGQQSTGSENNQPATTTTTMTAQQSTGSDPTQQSNNVDNGYTATSHSKNSNSIATH